MREQLMEILKELRPDVDFEKEKALVTDGILDSFDIVSLVGELNAQFSIAIGVDELEPENFDTVDTIQALVSRLED